MIQGFTVAIPTMRRWSSFLEKSIPQYLDYDLVSYVVVCDETGEDAKALLESPYANHPKLKVYTNPKRLGAYLNKRQCIEKAPSDWVAVLDSDNIFSEDFFEKAYAALQKESFDSKLVLASADNVRRRKTNLPFFWTSHHPSQLECCFKNARLEFSSQ